MPRYRATSSGTIEPLDLPRHRQASRVHRMDSTVRSAMRAQVKAEPWCSWCWAEDDLTADHIVPTIRGGHPTDPSNIRTLCRTCNSRKGGR